MPAPKGNQYAKGNKGGRPTKYEQRYCKMIVDYFDKVPYKTVKGRSVPIRFPTIERFAFEIGVDDVTLQRWSEKHKEFCIAYRKARNLQKDILVANGMVGAYNPHFAKFVGMNMSGMKDRSDVTSDDEKIEPGVVIYMPDEDPNE